VCVRPPREHHGELLDRGGVCVRARRRESIMASCLAVVCFLREQRGERVRAFLGMQLVRVARSSGSQSIGVDESSVDGFVRRQRM
jgi:hypothetical protein